MTQKVMITCNQYEPDHTCTCPICTLSGPRLWALIASTSASEQIANSGSWLHRTAYNIGDRIDRLTDWLMPGDEIEYDPPDPDVCNVQLAYLDCADGDSAS